MLDPKNCTNLTFGVVADPELVNNNILKLRGAVDYAGSEKGSDNSSGYFDIVYYLNNDENPRNAKFVRSQVEAGNIKKGTQLQLIGRLVQERWTANDDSNKKNSRVTIVAESLTYAGGNRPAADSSSSGSSNQSASLPSEF